MRQTLGRILSLSILLAAGIGGIWWYRTHSADVQVRQLQEQKAQLQRIVQKLSSERRLAKMLVLEKSTVAGVPHTTVLFVEYDRHGRDLPARRFTVKGNEVHVNALVVKFEHDLVTANDPLRGHSLALFTRIYGDRQSPNDGHRIDEPGQVPAVYRDADPQTSAFEQELWQNFWRLAEDPAYRASKGVRVADGQSSWGPLEMDRLYVISIEADGGIHKTSQVIEPIYREAMKRGVQ